MGKSRASRSKPNGVAIKSNNGNVDLDSDEEVQISRTGKRRNPRSPQEASTSTRRSGRQQKGSTTRKSESESENSDNEAIAKKIKKPAIARRPTSAKRVTLAEPFSDEDSTKKSDSEDSDNEVIAKKVKKSANGKPSTSAKRVTLAEPFSDEDSDIEKKSEKTVTDKRGKKPVTSKKNADNSKDNAQITAKKALPPAKKGKSSTKSKATNAEDEKEEDEEYEVEDIVDHCVEGRRKYYKIRWKGYGPDSDTWELEKSIYATDLIVKYRESHPDDQPVQLKKKTEKRKKKKTVEAPPKKIKIDQMPGYEEEKSDAEVEWEVERIVDVHFCKDNTREFLIRWKDFSSNADTWEPEANLDCKEMINKYMAKVDRVASVSQKELRIAPAHTQRFTLMEPAGGRRLSKRNSTRQRVLYHDAE